MAERRALIIGASRGIGLGLVIAGLIYWRGSRHGQVASRWRIAAFFGGLAALFIALVSPVEELADHVFAVHQVEHMLLRSVAPMLLFLSAPQAAMVRGSPPLADQILRRQRLAAAAGRRAALRAAGDRAVPAVELVLDDSVLP